MGGSVALDVLYSEKETIWGRKTVKTVRSEGQWSSHWHSRDTAGRELGLQAKKQCISSLITTYFNMHMYIHVMLANQCHICHLIVTHNAPVCYTKCDNATVRCTIPPIFIKLQPSGVEYYTQRPSLPFHIPLRERSKTFLEQDKNTKYSLAAFTNTTINLCITWYSPTSIIRRGHMLRKIISSLVSWWQSGDKDCLKMAGKY